MNSILDTKKKSVEKLVKELEEQGIVKRTIYSEVPLHVEYELMERGQRLRPIFEAMTTWALAEDTISQSEQ